MSEKIYDPEFVRDLFDEMSRTYGIVNVISSFGFCSLWRYQCLSQIDVEQGSHVVDLMTGMGELYRLISKRIGKGGRISGFDISSQMCSRAVENAEKLSLNATTVETDVLLHSFEPDSADAVVSCFGLKTFSDSQLERLVKQLARVLRPGGQFAFLEISVPKNRLLKIPYMFYLNRIIPVIGRMMMGNPDNYRLLGVYTRQFSSCERVVEIFKRQGLSVNWNHFFFGCATGLAGRRLN